MIQALQRSGNLPSKIICPELVITWARAQSQGAIIDFVVSVHFGDIEAVVNAALLAVEKVPAIGFARHLIGATTPFTHDDLFDLRADVPSVLRRRVPDYEAVYAHPGWKMLPTIDRVYVNEHAKHELGWQPRYSFTSNKQTGQRPVCLFAIP